MKSQSLLPLIKNPSKTFKDSQLQTILTDALTIFWGEWLDLRARIPQIAATGLISPLIYIFAFGLGLGSALDRVMEPAAGESYLEFILPGMAALSSMTISFAGTTFSIFDILYDQAYAMVAESEQSVT